MIPVEVEIPNYLSEMVDNKTVCFVGPSVNMDGESYGCEIEKFDVIIRTNGSCPIPREQWWDRGRSCTILYLNGLYFTNCAKDLSAEVLNECGVKLIIAKGSLNDSVLAGGLEKYGIKFSQTATVRLPNIKRSPLYGATIVSHIIRCKPSLFKLFGMDFYTIPKHCYDGYHPQKIADILCAMAKAERKTHPHDPESNMHYILSKMNDVDFIGDRFLQKMKIEWEQRCGINV